MDGKTVLITGAKGGLGTHVTQAFLNAGATVAGVSRSIKQSDFPHERFRAFASDLSNAASATKLVQDIRQSCGRIDALVHLMGGFAGGKALADTDDETFEQMFDINLRSAFVTMRTVIPVMRELGEGRIVAIGSRAAQEASPGMASYAAFKAALVSLVRSIAAENRDAGITANIILPGTMDTPSNRASSPDGDFSRWIQPANVADLIVWLASDAAAQVNGAVIPIYGRDV